MADRFTSDERPSPSEHRSQGHLAKFDRILAEAAAEVAERPLRTSLTARELERMAAYHYALALQEDELRRAGGLSMPQFAEEKANTAELLHETRLALAMGQIEVMEDFLSTLLDLSKINLDRTCQDYRRLGMTILAQEVEALEAIEKRNEGRVVATPKAAKPSQAAPASTEGGALTAAFKGWKKAKQPSPSTLREYQHAVDRFIELHGDMPVVGIKRSHVLAFREALQDISPRRSGALRDAPLPVLVEWRAANPDAPRINPGTVNKLLGGVQAIARWARDNGLIDDDTPWADPFANMRLEEDEPEREPWPTADLVKLFASPVFTEGKRPKAGGGEAAFWLPLMGLYSGARLSELASLKLSDIAPDEASKVPFFSITEDLEEGKRLKTQSSRRMVPVHPELIRLGFLRFVENERKKRGKDAPLFPECDAESWSKWFGRLKHPCHGAPECS